MTDDKNMSPADIKYSIWDTRTDENQKQVIEKSMKSFEHAKQNKRK